LSKLKNLSRRTLVILAVVAIMLSMASVVAAGVVAQQTITGTGTITVTAPSDPDPVAPTFSFSVEPTTIDFSGSMERNNAYSKTVQVTITNTGTDGKHGGGSATIQGITAALGTVETEHNWIEGTSITGTYTGPPLAVGQSGTMDITLSIPEGSVTQSGTYTLPNFGINLAASN
jgi:hypothetical protein